MNVKLSARPTHNMINQDKQLFLSVSSIFQPLAWAAVKRGPGPSPPCSITSWKYSCKSNVKVVSFGDYNTSTVGESFFNTPAHCAATSAHEAEDEPGKPQLDSTPHPSHLPGSFSCGVPQFSHWYYDEYTTQTAHQCCCLGWHRELNVRLKDDNL